MPERADIERHERLGEAAYERMYDARGRDVKDCYDDAREHLFAAARIAEALGLEAEAARLRARLDHVMAVFASQFRGTY